jgi:hypothetical protein
MKPGADAQYLIASGSDMYAGDQFEYPTGVVIRPTGLFSYAQGLEYEGLELTQGEIRTVDGQVPTALRFRARHVGGSIHTGDSITVFAEVDNVWLSVGWFGVMLIESGASQS